MRIAAAAVIISVVLCSSQFVLNAQAARIGPVEVTPFLDVGLCFDDNVYARDTSRKEDFYLQLSPGLALRNEKTDNRLELEYRADLYRYLDTGELNDVDDHRLKAAAYLNTDGRFWLKLDDIAARGHEPRSEAFMTRVALNRYYSNHLDAQIGLRVSDKFSVALLGNSYVVDFTNNTNNYRDRTDDGGGLSLHYRVLPKTDLLVQGIYKRIYHNDDSDPMAARLNSYENWVLTGVTWDITDKSTGSVRFGYEWKDFDHSDVQDYSTPVYLVSLEHRFTPKTSVTISGARQAKETDDPNTEYFTTTSGTLALGFRPVRKLELSPYASFAHNRYSGATEASDGDRGRRIEDVWLYGLEVTYRMNKWLALSLGYEHAKKSSTLTEFNYTRNRASFTISASL